MKKSAKSLLSLITVLSILLSSFSAVLCVYADNGFNLSDDDRYYARTYLKTDANGDNLVFAYDKLKDGIEEMQTTIQLSDSQHIISTEDIQRVYLSYIYDHTETFWAPKTISVSGNESTGLSAILEYPFSKEERNTKRSELNEKIAEYLKDITPQMEEFEREKIIHDRIIDNVDYDREILKKLQEHVSIADVQTENGHNIYDALVEEDAVCEGYAYAFKYLLNCVGIQSIIVTGSAETFLGEETTETNVEVLERKEDHAWNIVRIDGKYYQTDVTWDDPVFSTAIDGFISYAYFNITSDLISHDHTIDKFISGKYDGENYTLIYPVDNLDCSNTEKNYYIYKGAFFSDFDWQNIYSLIKNSDTPYIIQYRTDDKKKEDGTGIEPEEFKNRIYDELLAEEKLEKIDPILFGRLGINAVYLDLRNKTKVTPPDKVTGVYDEMNGPYLQVRWDAQNNISGYQIQRKTSKGAEFADLDEDYFSDGFTDLTATVATPYYYRIRAYKKRVTQNANKTYYIYGEWSDVNSEAWSPQPIPIYDVVAKSAGATSMKVTWSPAENVTGYKVYRAVGKDSGYKQVATVNTNTFTDTNLICGTQYFYKVCAYTDVDGRIIDGMLSGYYANYPVPAVTTGVKASCASSKTVTLSWTKQSGVSGYQIFRSTSKTSGFKAIDATSACSYKDSATEYGKTYYYRVAAYKEITKDEGILGASSAVVGPVYTYSATPAISALTNSGAKKVTVTWKKAAGATGYQIYRATSKNGTYKKLANVASSKVSYVDSAVAYCKTYYYKIRTYRTVGGKTVYSSYSSVKGIYTPPSAATVTAVKNSASKKATVTFKKVSGASGYQIYRATSKSGKYTLVGTVGASKSSFVNSKLTKKKTYYYKIRTYRTVSGKKIYGSYSNIKYVKINK